MLSIPPPVSTATTTTSWKDGRAFGAVVNHIREGLVDTEYVAGTVCHGVVSVHVMCVVRGHDLLLWCVCRPHLHLIVTRKPCI